MEVMYIIEAYIKHSVLKAAIAKALFSSIRNSTVLIFFTHITHWVVDKATTSWKTLRQDQT